MEMDAMTEPAALDRRALARPTAEVLTWATHPVRAEAGAQAAYRVYRLRGTARDGALTLPWALQLTVARPDTAAARRRRRAMGPSPAGLPSVALREVLAYQSGLLEDLPGGLAAPRPASA